MCYRNLVPSNILLWGPPNIEGCWESVQDVHQIKLKLGEVGSSHFVTDEALSSIMVGRILPRHECTWAPEIKATIRDTKIETRFSKASDVYSLARCFLALFMKGI